MAFKLNQSMFKRLVQLSLLSLVVSVGSAIYEVVDPTWSAFSADFDALVERYFGQTYDIGYKADIGLAILLIGLLVWNVVSLVAALSFKRWARIGLWMPYAAMIVIGSVAPGLSPSYTTPLYDLLFMLDAAVVGAIMLLTYSTDHGDRWFNATPTTDHEV